MGQSPRGTPFQPSNTLCMLLSDMREIRSKQADLSNALRRSLPPDWWGQPADSNLKEKLKLGDRFKLCQVFIILLPMFSVSLLNHAISYQ